jgi:hypothetical protein
LELKDIDLAIETERVRTDPDAVLAKLLTLCGNAAASCFTPKDGMAPLKTVLTGARLVRASVELAAAMKGPKNVTQRIVVERPQRDRPAPAASVERGEAETARGSIAPSAEETPSAGEHLPANDHSVAA